MYIISLLISTIQSRPYVFFYTAVALIIAYYYIGTIRTIIFWIIGYLTAFICEYSSTRNGFPFGLYHYINKNPHELYISNVPFWDSLSFAFLSFAGFTLATFIIAAYKKKPPLTIRHSPFVLLLTPFLVTFVDIIVDPIAHLGDRWFLGKIYYYEYPGLYFDVPISNFLGWYFVCFITILIFQIIDRLLLKKIPFPQTYEKNVHIATLIFYFVIVIFHIGIAFSIKEPRMGFVDIFLFIPLAYWIIKAYKKHYE